jgi:UDP-glucose 4-epimerase
VRHFVFVSTIRVLGEASDSPFTKAHPRRPVDAYAESKAQAEVWLMAQRGRIPSISIVRPPLVYGPGVRANFLRLMNAVGRGWPLPVGCAVAPRSQIAVTNLTHFLGTCARHSHTCELLHCRDDEDYSVRDLVLLLAQCMGRKARLLSIEPRVVRACARLVGAGDAAARVFERAQVDDSEARVLLSWQPPVDSRTALAATVRWWCTR